MPRRKAVHITNPRRVQEICIQRKFDPFEEMVKQAMDDVRVPEGIGPEAMAELAKRYDLVEGADGKIHMRLAVMNRFAILSDLAQYVYPKLRSSETKEEKDFKLTVLIQSFDKQEPKTITVEPVRQITEGKVGN